MPSLGRTRLFCLAFVAMLLAFNWPIVSIPGPGRLLAWLFGAWAAAIGLLFVISRRPEHTLGDAGTLPEEDGPEAPSQGGDPDV